MDPLLLFGFLCVALLAYWDVRRERHLARLRAELRAAHRAEVERERQARVARCIGVSADVRLAEDAGRALAEADRKAVQK